MVFDLQNPKTLTQYITLNEPMKLKNWRIANKNGSIGSTANNNWRLRKRFQTTVNSWEGVFVNGDD